MATFLVSFIILLWIKCIVSEISLDIGAGDTSEFYTMTCKSSYCSNTTIFTLNNGAKTCHNPLLTVHFRLTDFSDAKLQYLTITLNQQELGKCTGPNNATYYANYDTSSIPLYTDCLNDFSIAELVGYNPSQITLQLSISPHVNNIHKTYNNNLLYSQIAFGCSDEQTKQIISQEWDPSLPVPANTNIQCIQSGCQASAHFIVLSPEQCRVPLLSLQFWLTDFDQDYEYLTVEINGEYLGICEGGKQIEINNNIILTNEEEDKYFNNYSYWCFREVDISRYTGIEPEDIEIRLSLEETVDRNWLDLSPTPYLLDAIIKMDCTDKTQDEIIPQIQTYDRTRHSNYYPYPHELKIKCQEIECGGLWEWKILGHCQYPVLSLYYYAQHYDDSMVQILINENIFGNCGPIDDIDIDINDDNVRVCFEGLELHELLNNNWNSRSDFNGNPDAISNSFQFGFALTEIDKLDGIINSSVAELFINLNCSSETHIKDNEIVHINEYNKDINGFPYGESELNCVYAGCSSKLIFELDVSFIECEIPKLDLYFWLTDFGIENEFISVIINNHLYGWCDGGKDKYFENGIYKCLHKADIQEWTDWDINGNKLELILNASSAVNGLDTNKDGFLINAKARLTCYNKLYDNKIQKVNIYPNDISQKKMILPFKCQGIGCFTYSIFNIRNNICYQPKLSVQFWLSDFLTFDEYVSVGINGRELQKCRGGSDKDFDTIWTCFQGKDIRYMLIDYIYNNNNNNFKGYYIDINDVLNISLQISETALWLDHSFNYSILQGMVTLECEPNNIPIIIDNNDNNNEDISDSDNDTFRFIQLNININKISADILLEYFTELQTRFEYSLDATIHFEDNKSDRIPFTIKSQIIIIDPKQVSNFQIYITTLSNNNAKEIKKIIEMDIFLFIFQETLRDSHFKHCILESINEIKIISNLPHDINDNDEITITTTKSSSSFDTTIDNNDNNNDNDIPSKTNNNNNNNNFLKILFTSASATDWLSFIGVIALSILLCLCCIGCVGIICVYQQKNKTRKEIQKYKQTNIGDSDTDEMQGMINNELEVMKQQSHKSISIYKNENVISEKIKMVNRANNLKDKVERHHSQSGIYSHKKKKHKNKSKNKNKNKRRLSNSYSHSIVSHSHSQYINNNNEQQAILNNNNNNNEIELTQQQHAIHPALSTAIQTVNKMNNLKCESIAKTHGLVVNQSIIEESDSESESLPSGIDLSEEFINLNDDIEVSISVNDIDDINDIKKKQHKRNKSKNKKLKNKKYSSINQTDDYYIHDNDSDNNNNNNNHYRGDKVFGMKIVEENQETNINKHKIEHIKNKSSKIPNIRWSDNDSDDLSDLSDSGLREQSLNSLTHEFSQMI